MLIKPGDTFERIPPKDSPLSHTLSYAIDVSAIDGDRIVFSWVGDGEAGHLDTESFKTLFRKRKEAITCTAEYQLIKNHYGFRRAERSKMPLINHINEGLKILDRLDASEEAKRAFCLHPLVQGDRDLKDNYYKLSNDTNISSAILILSMEYRSVANEFLSAKMDTWSGHTDIRLSPLKCVNDMLIADKVQNRKDFELYHKGTHARSMELTNYFRLWLLQLEINEEKYQNLIRDL